MDSNHILRSLDPCGRIVLPSDFRHRLQLHPGDRMEIAVTNGFVTLEKYQPRCIFCGDSAALLLFKEKQMCKKCRHGLMRLR